MNDAVFNQYGQYYDLLYQDKNYAAEADYVATALRKAMPGVEDVLEFGSGTGRHGWLLAKQGFSVVGVENSQAMMLSARRAKEINKDAGAGNFTCELGDIRSFKIDRKFDAVISLFHVVSYQTSDHDLLSVFTNAAYHLREQGVFFFDVWHGPAVLAQRPTARRKTAENSFVRLVRDAEPLLNVASRVVTVTYTLLVESKRSGKRQRFEEQHALRYLFPEEIAMLANQTGFSVERSEEFLTGSIASDKSWGVAYLLRKRA